MQNYKIKEKIKSNVYKISEKRGRSRIWDCFAIIKDENGSELINYVVCKMCYNVYKYHKNAMSNLNKHRCYTISKIKRENESTGDLIEPSQEAKRACTDILTEWVLGDIRPITLVEDNGLRAYSKLMLSLGNKVGSNVTIESLIPQSSTILRNVEMSYGKHFAKLKSEMSVIQETGYALTCYLWTENLSKISYLALTAHYVMDSECKSKLLGIKSMKGISNTSANIKQKIENLLGEFNCSLHDPMVLVTDKGGNMKAAIKECENINCINHLIFNTVEKCVSNSPQVNEIITASSKLVTFLKKSGLDCDLNIPLNSFTPTRSNTAYFNLLSIKHNFDDVLIILTEKNLTDEYSVLKENYLDQLIDTLKPFMDATKELEDSSHVTMHLVHPHIENLKQLCSNNNFDEPSFITDFKTKLHDTLVSLVESKMSIYHKLAIFLFPPANQLIQFSLKEQTEVLAKCKSMLYLYLNETFIVNASDEAKPSKIYSLFEKYVQPLEGTNSGQSIIEKEIIKYRTTTVPLQNDFNILKWWNDRKDEFPLLYKLSSRIFAIPASSAPSERIFSIGRTLITDKRSKLGFNDKSFQEILFVNINSKD